MRELVLYASEIEKYVSYLNVSADEKRKAIKAIAEIMTLLKERGEAWPNESDYERYRASSKTNDKTTTQNISRIKKFFAWLERENAAMIETDIALDASASTNTQEETPTGQNEPDTWPPAQAVKPKNKGGRKIMSANGQKKTEKLMLYLTPETITDMRDWCRLKGISAVSYITALVEADLHSKADKINTFRKLSEDA